MELDKFTFLGPPWTWKPMYWSMHVAMKRGVSRRLHHVRIIGR